MADQASKIVYAGAGAAIGFSLGGPVGAFVGAGIGFATGTYMTPDIPNYSYDNEPGGQTIRTSDAPAQWIFGRVALGGNVSFFQEQSGEQSSGEWLHVVYVLSAGAITAVDEILVDDVSVDEYPDHVSYEVVIDPTEPNAFLLENCPDWTEDMIGQGLSWVRMSYKFDNEKFPGGIPKVQFIVRGLECYDPRTEEYAYSDNPVLQYMTVCKDLFGYPLDEFNIDAMIAGANLCDEIVTNPDDSTSKRYTSGAIILATDDKPSIIQKFEQACGGCQIEIGGRRFLQPGAYYGPYDFTITKDMTIGSIQPQFEADITDRINTVTGTFIDPDGSWERTDYPRVQNTGWVTEDETELTEDLSLAYVTDVYQAQRLAWMHLKKRRTGGRIAFGMNFAGYYCRPGTVVRVYLPEINIDGEYVVDKWDLVSFSTGSDNAAACTVELSAYDPDIFDDAVGQAYTPPVYMSLPTGGVAAPAELVWTPKTETEGIQGILSWTPPYATVDHYNVLVENSVEEVVQTAQVPGGAASCNIGGLPAGIYNIKVASVRGTARSGYAAIAVNINVPPVPEAITYYADLFSITVVPSNPVNGTNNGWYEFFFSLSEVSDPVNNAEELGSGLSFTKTGLSFNTTYHFYVRSANVYGKSGFAHLEASTSNDVSALIAALSEQITLSELAQELLEPIESIPNIQAAVDSLNNTINDLLGAPSYDPEEEEIHTDDLRTYDGHIYKALQEMTTPLGIPVPTDTDYWVDLGVFTSIAAELAGIQSQIADFQSVIDGQAQTISIMRSQARAQDDGGVAELMNALDMVDSRASIAEEKTARADADSALAADIETLNATVNDPETGVEATATAVQGLTTQVDHEETGLLANASAIQQLSAEVDSEETGLPSKASAEDLTEVEATLEDVTAERTIKVQVRTSDGKLVMAGMGLIASSEEDQSELYLLADKVAILNSLEGTPAALFQEGTTYINNAFIANLTSSNLKANTLSALFANMGTITAGKMQSVDGKMLIDLDNKIIRITA